MRTRSPSHSKSALFKAFAVVSSSAEHSTIAINNILAIADTNARRRSVFAR
jgi:hypothetical protein